MKATQEHTRLAKLAAADPEAQRAAEDQMRAEAAVEGITLGEPFARTLLPLRRVHDPATGQQDLVETTAGDATEWLYTVRWMASPLTAAREVDDLKERLGAVIARDAGAIYDVRPAVDAILDLLDREGWLAPPKGVEQQR